jgi:hypothetical protein
MKTLGIMLLCLFVAGCSSLILREDDTTGETVAKVATRSLIALPTLFMSEAHINNLKQAAKRAEKRAEQRAEQAVRFGELCESEGYEFGTAEYKSCVSVKLNQVEQLSGVSNERPLGTTYSPITHPHRGSGRHPP